MSTAAQEAESDIGLSNEAISKLRSVFAEIPAVEKVIIYGSRAKGNYRPASDIDLTIQGADVTWQDLQTIELKIDDLLLPYKVDLSLFEHIDNENLRDHIKSVGKIFYEKANDRQPGPSHS